MNIGIVLHENSQKFIKAFCDVLSDDHHNLFIFDARSSVKTNFPYQNQIVFSLLQHDLSFIRNYPKLNIDYEILQKAEMRCELPICSNVIMADRNAGARFQKNTLHQITCLSRFINKNIGSDYKYAEYMLSELLELLPPLNLDLLFAYCNASSLTESLYYISLLNNYEFCTITTTRIDTKCRITGECDSPSGSQSKFALNNSLDEVQQPIGFYKTYNTELPKNEFSLSRILQNLRVNSPPRSSSFQHAVVNKIKLIYNKLLVQIISSSLHSQPDFDLYPNVIGYPLHVSPEASLNIAARDFMDELHAIKTICAGLPISSCLYIKEHPHMHLRSKRPVNFYREILSIPNAFIAPFDLPLKNFLDQITALVTIHSTMGIEASLQGIPVFCFSRNSSYSNAECITHVERYDSVSIFKCIYNSGPLDRSEITKQMLDELDKLYGESFDFDIRVFWNSHGINHSQMLDNAKALAKALRLTS